MTKNTIVGTHTGDGLWIETTVKAGDEYAALLVVCTDGTPTWDFYPDGWKQYAVTVDMENHPDCFEVVP